MDTFRGPCHYYASLAVQNEMETDFSADMEIIFRRQAPHSVRTTSLRDRNQKQKRSDAASLAASKNGQAIQIRFCWP